MPNTAVFDALVIYQEIASSNEKIWQFRHDLTNALADVGEPESARHTCDLRAHLSNAPIHGLEDYEETIEIAVS